MVLEEAIQRSIFTQNSEKTFIDKLLGRDDINKIRELIKKPMLTRSDIIEILYLLSSSESKLWNLGEWERYVLLKFFVWIREFVKLAELLYDYKDTLNDPKNKIVLSRNTIVLVDNNEKLIQHSIKFLVDLYLNIGRTSLSIGATGFLEILKNKYEISYPNAPINTGANVPNNGGNNVNMVRG